jgi:hypothetical protein
VFVHSFTSRFHVVVRLFISNVEREMASSSYFGSMDRAANVKQCTFVYLYIVDN